MIAPKTDNLFTRDLMFDAVPNSSASILLTLDIWSFGGMINEIILVPFLQGKVSQQLPHTGHTYNFHIQETIEENNYREIRLRKTGPTYVLHDINF